MKKKLFALFLAVLTLCGLAGCSYSVDSEPSFTQSPVSSPTAYTPEPATPAPTLEPTTTMTERATQTPEKNAEKTATGYAETKENTIHKNGRQNRHRIHYRYRVINTIVPAAAILKSPSMQSHCPMQKHRGIRLARSVNHEKACHSACFFTKRGASKSEYKAQACSSVGSAQIFPPCDCRISRQMESPNPATERPASEVNSGSKIWESCEEGTPSPLSSAAKQMEGPSA